METVCFNSLFVCSRNDGTYYPEHVLCVKNIAKFKSYIYVDNISGWNDICDQITSINMLQSINMSIL